MKRDRLTGLIAIGFSLCLSCMVCAAETTPQVELQQNAQTQLYIQTEPAGAQVNVDEKLKGESPHLFQLELPEGVDRVVVEIEKEGYQRKTQQITIQGGRVTRVKFELDPVSDQERLSAANVKSQDSAEDAGRLDFRLAPVRSEAATDPAMITLLDEEVESSWSQWQDRGPQAVDDPNAAYRWFPVRGEIARELITRELNGKTYVLLSNQPGQIMLSHQENEPRWGLRNIASVVEGRGSPLISGEFDEAGSRRMHALTQKLVKNHLAVLLNDEVITTPRIVGPFSQRFVIHGRFDAGEIQRIVSSLLRGMVWPATSKDEDTARHIVRLLEAAVQRYRLDMGRVPSTEEGLTALRTLPDSESNTDRWQGPYVSGAIPTDPWGNAFRYRSPGQKSGGSFDLWSAGPDGEDGTRDDIGTWRESNE